ncbi:MAG: hypothetical protein LBD06_00300 [Candidatus Accumulibacter sp.]|jgi:uncharacterized protein|nr:hypothetical protein [Accumulibacter sp.]
MSPIAKTSLSGHFASVEQNALPTIADEARMNIKAFAASVLLASNLFATSEVSARPDLTPEALAKARELAAQIKPPFDLDALLKEADGLSVECEEFDLKADIKTCSNDVKISQSKERQAIIDKEIQAGRERQTKFDEEARRMLKELADEAEKRLNQS